jgi:Sulfotransferase domain
VATARGLAGLGAIPDAIIIGAQKCGTSSLFHYLEQHPRLGSARTKEVHYFDLHFDRGPYWYRGQFRRRPGEIVVEASPYYLFHPAVPARAAALLPAAKLIVVMREPVARAYSHYQHARAKGHETLGFEEAIAAERERMGDSHDALADGRIRRSHAHQHFSYISRGFYADQIARWQKHYPADSFLFLRAEDLFAAPQESFDQACSFLGLPQVALPDASARNARSYDRMRPEMRAELARLYEEPNRRLAELTSISWD